jgi:hypothetical protein
LLICYLDIAGCVDIDWEEGHDLVYFLDWILLAVYVTERRGTWVGFVFGLDNAGFVVVEWEEGQKLVIL